MSSCQRFSNIIEKKSGIFFALFALLLVFSIAGIFRVRINPDLMIFMPRTSPAKTSFDSMNRVFESRDELIVMLHTEMDTLDAETRNTVVALHDTLNSLPYVSSVVSPVIDHRFTNVSLSEDMSVMKRHEGEWKIFMSVFTTEIPGRSKIEHIESLLSDSGMNYDVTGTAFLQKRLVDFILQILCYLPFIAIFLILLVFRFQMRSAKATFMSVLPAIVGAVWTLGLAGWIGKEVSIVTAVAPIFTIVIGSADGLHFVSHYIEARKRNEAKKKAVCSTLRLVGIPMIITTLTTAGGFLSLLVMDTDAVWELAIFTSAGIIFAALATWFLLPLFLINAIDLKISRIHLPPIGGKVIKQHLWGKTSFIIAAGITIIAFLGFSSVKTDFNPLSMFKPSTDVIKSAEAIAEVQGGSLPVYLFVRHDNDILNNELRSGINSLCDSLRHYGKVLSPYDVLGRITEQPQFRMMRYFSSEREILADILQMEQLPFGYMIDTEQHAARITVMPSSLSSDTLMAMKKIVESAGIINADVAITGISYIMEDLNRRMVGNLKNTLMLSAGIMFLLLFVSLRRFVPVLLSLIPVLVTTFALYGFLGFSGLSLSVVTALVFSISIGIGVDYAVHLTYTALKLKDVQKAFDYTARPVMTNALGLAIGMTALVTTPLTIHMHISIMMWVAMMVSMFLSLSLLPTQLNMYFKKTNKHPDET